MNKTILAIVIALTSFAFINTQNVKAIDLSEGTTAYTFGQLADRITFTCSQVAKDNSIKNIFVKASCDTTMTHLKNIDCKSIMAPSILDGVCDVADNYFKIK